MPGLKRYSFSDLQPSSSSSSSSGHYSASCCDLVPGLCGSQGTCALKVTDCVSFCICVRSPDLPWCGEELQRLHDVLRRRGLSDGRPSEPGDAGPGAGSEGGDSDSPFSGPLGISGHQLATEGPLSLAGLSLDGAAFAGPDLGTSGGAGGEEAGSSTDHVMSPAQLASSLTAALGDGASSGQDDVTGDSHSARDQRAPPKAAMMVNGGGEEGDGGEGGGERNKSSSTPLHEESSLVHNRTAEHNPRLSSTSGHDDLNTTNTTNTAAATTVTTTAGGRFFAPWWPTDDYSCGSECELNGGRCVFEFNQTHTQVCVYDVQPCRAFNCVHGACVARNDTIRCECEEGWGGVFCSKECPLDCGPHGSCVIIRGEVICRCDVNYTGARCGELKPTPPPWTGVTVRDGVTTEWQIAAGCLAVAALLLLLLLLVAYVMWRRQWLPMRKLVHYFQQYEEDDGKEFDAFISYRSRSRDEMFVLHELYPHLERHLDFKLCMHFRDFPPGETIADNIIQAIENSRRTILVLSPAYVQSEWCRLEYQKAQHEMLKLRHKIIPILIEDLSQLGPVDRNLRAILDTVTYIQWPGSHDSKRLDKFWKLLKLSMPKKKSDLTRSLSSAESCGSDRPLTAVSLSCFSQVVCSMSDGALQPQRSLSLSSSLEEATEEVEVGGEQQAAAHASDGHDSHPTTVTCCDSDQSTDSGCPRDRTTSCASSSSSSGEETPPVPCDMTSPLGRALQDEAVRHVTSDDHIVEIREFPGDQVRVTPWLPARITTRC
ncbi:uncharacterized protein LOC143279928 isoform X2 [Babylonia areolata]